MTSYRYRALNDKGVSHTGVMEAVSEKIVIQHLRDQGLIPISAEAEDAADWRSWLTRDILPKRKASGRDLAMATQELATLLRAGLELDRAMQVLIGLAEIGALAAPLAKVQKKLRDGASLSEALADEGSFPKFYVNMVRAGELGGSLEATLFRLADYLSRAQALREAVISALVYPIMLLCTAGLSIAVILIVVLPQFEPLFADAGKALPLSTRIVMSLGHFLGATWWVILILLGMTGGWLQRQLAKPAFRLRWDSALLRLPLLGDLLIKIEMERFSRTLGTLTGNGVTLPMALAITRDTLSNRHIADFVGEAANSLREGESLAGKLARSPQFPSLVVDLVKVGEETGRLDEMLLRLADLYEHSVKHRIERLLALLVPLLTVVLGLIVAGLIGSMLVAILSVNDLAF